MQNEWLFIYFRTPVALRTHLYVSLSGRPPMAVIVFYRATRVVMEAKNKNIKKKIQKNTS